jgi:hypothetical protein
LAKFSQNQLWPGTPDSDRWCRLARRQLGALRKRERRRDYNSPDCPVVHRTVRWCTGLSGESTAPAANGRPRDQRATCGRTNDRLGTPDFPVRQPIPRTNGRAPDCYSGCPVVHRTIRCTTRQKARIAYQIDVQRLLAALGL